jgi:hypothetical protein
MPNNFFRSKNLSEFAGFHSPEVKGEGLLFNVKNRQIHHICGFHLVAKHI